MSTTTTTTTGTTQVNGISLSGFSYSITLDHLVSYPVISDLLNYYKSMPLGAKSIEISNNIYNAWGKPVLSSPLVQNPYSYVHPYAKRVDELGDNTLTHIDTNFPAVKETDLKSLRENANSAIGYPFKVAHDGKEYLLNTYSTEYRKNGGPGIVPASVAIVTTELRIVADALNKANEIFGPKKNEAEKKLGEAKEIGQEKVNNAREVGQEKVNNAKTTAQQKKNELAK